MLKTETLSSIPYGSVLRVINHPDRNGDPTSDHPSAFFLLHPLHFSASSLSSSSTRLCFLVYVSVSLELTQYICLDSPTSCGNLRNRSRSLSSYVPDRHDISSAATLCGQTSRPLKWRTRHTEYLYHGDPGCIATVVALLAEAAAPGMGAAMRALLLCRGVHVPVGICLRPDKLGGVCGNQHRVAAYAKPVDW